MPKQLQTIKKTNNIKELVNDLFFLFTPPLKMETSAWAEKYRILSQESSALPGQWRNSQAPHLVEIMNQADIREVREIVVMSSAQMGKSECVNNIAAKKAHLEPGPIMIVQPTIMAAQDYSKDRIVPMIRDSAVLEKIFDNKAATLLHKPFLGGHLTLMGANSPTQLASRPIKILLIDEEDRMRVTSEGDPVAIAMKRTTTFRDRKIVHISTPSLKGLSRIERHFLQSDQRKRFVPCPYCHHYQELRWSQVKWDKSGERHLSKTAAYECEECKVRWSEKERFIALAKGVWRATNDDPVDGKVGFHISELYSLWRTMPQIVQDFLNCTDNPDLLQVFYNTALGVPYERIVSGIPWKRLKLRAEKYDLNLMPRTAFFLTAGCDVQADRIAIELVAWGNNFETWTMGYWQLLGDTGGNKVWDELTEFFHKVRILDENGTPCEIDKIAIDAGFNTQNVKRWVVRNSNTIPVIGRAKRNAIISLPSIEETRKDKKDKAYGVKSYLVGVDKVKEELTGFLNQEIFDEDGDRLIPFGYCHFHESCTDAYFQEITSEHQVKKRVKGAEVYEWSVLPGRRNEALDCRIYARAAAYHLGYDRMSLGMMQRMKPEKKEKSKALWSRKDIK